MEEVWRVSFLTASPMLLPAGDISVWTRWPEHGFVLKAKRMYWVMKRLECKFTAFELENLQRDPLWPLLFTNEEKLKDLFMSQKQFHAYSKDMGPAQIPWFYFEVSKQIAPQKLYIIICTYDVIHPMTHLPLVSFCPPSGPTCWFPFTYKVEEIFRFLSKLLVGPGKWMCSPQGRSL